MKILTDCLHFRGDLPCKPHKQYGYHCDYCPAYQKISQQILLIKLGAIGDVIRSTPLITKIRSEFPLAHITWLTQFPAVVPKSEVDKILNTSAENIEYLKNRNFDWLINLDKDDIAIALTNSISAKKKNGFTIDEFGRAKPLATEAEKHKWLTGLFDDLNKENKKHYVQEIFEICGYDFNDEEYLLDVNNEIHFEINKTKKVIGLNTGCGGRWTSRLWPTEYWIELAKKLSAQNFEVVLLGGEQEDEKNKFIAKESGAKYLGHYNLEGFIALVNQCDLVVTAVTMAMHLTIGLKKKIVLFNNIFNKHEFYLYNRGIILEPDFDCDCYYAAVCPNDCMQYLKAEKVFEAINELINDRKEKNEF